VLFFVTEFFGELFITALMHNRILRLFNLTLTSLALCSLIIPDAESQSISDSLFTIPGVVISASRSDHFSDDTRSEVYNSEKLRSFSGESLGSFLTGNSALHIRNYGAAGSASSVSVRGTSSSHVQVNWNGFPVNSVTLGSCDFSMLPSAGFDRVAVIYGASGSVYGSGTFGGAVNLDNNLDPGKVFGADFSSAYQSLNGINGSLSLHAGSEKTAFKIHTWGAASDNKFTYYDYIRQDARSQTDGNWKDAGVIQGLAIKLSKVSAIEAGLWYQVKSYNIPSRIGSTSYESQKDSTLRLYAAYKTRGRNWSLKIKSAMFDNYQGYRQKAAPESEIYSIKSDISSTQLFGDINFRYYPQSRLSVDAGLTGTYISADVSSYGAKQHEKGIAAFAGVKYSLNHLVITSSLREEWSNTYGSGLLPSLGFSWKILKENVEIKANISRKFRKPTFNDLFWQPGGNRDLKPESGLSADAGSSILLLKQNHHKLTSEAGIYLTRINNMILWRPSGTYWTAQNHNLIKSAGIETGLKSEIKHDKWNLTSELKVIFNRSVAVSDNSNSNERMLYSPAISSFAETTFSTGLIAITVNQHFASERYYDESHSLDPYYLADIITGIKIKAGPGKMGFYGIINNITGTTYELIRLYPMPGRYFSLKINYSF